MAFKATPIRPLNQFNDLYLANTVDADKMDHKD